MWGIKKSPGEAGRREPVLKSTSVLTPQAAASDDVRGDGGRSLEIPPSSYGDTDSVRQSHERSSTPRSNKVSAAHHVWSNTLLPATIVEGELAWALASVVDPYLTIPERHHLYAAIGIGETLSVIEVLLPFVVRLQLTLSADVVEAFGSWLNAYTHHDDEPRMRHLIGQVPTGPPPHRVVSAAHR
jgi:hypothetical protein